MGRWGRLVYLCLVIIPLIGLASPQEVSQEPCTITIDTAKDDYVLAIERTFPKPIQLVRLSFSSDVFFERSEFLYLMGMQEGAEICADDLIGAITHLIKKNKFSTIELRVTPWGQGVHLHIDLVGFWSFAKVKVHGVLLGKDTYKRYYAMDPGDPFDETRHQYSLEKIREELKADGFFNSSVASWFQKNENTKTIIVHIDIAKGSRFSLGDVVVSMRAHSDIDPQECAMVQERIERNYLRRMPGASYNKKYLNKQGQAVRRYLLKHGFLHTTIELQERISKREQAVHLVLTIDVHGKKKFIFSGNNFFTDNFLLEKLLELGSSLWLLPIPMLQEEILKLYWEKGFRQVAVKVHEEPSEVTFVIDEGTRAQVVEVLVEGAHFYTQEDLIKQYFKKIIKHGHADEALLQNELETLLDAYKRNGFLDVAVRTVIWDRLNEHNQHRVRIVLDEGTRSYLRAVTIPGFEHLEGQGPCTVAAEQAFNPLCLREQRAWLVEQLRGQGYAQPQVKPEVQRSGDSVTVTWRISVSPSMNMRFGKTVVVGSSGFPFELIKRELCYKEGEPWDQQALKKTLVRIKDLDVFERVHVYPYDAAKQEEDKDVLIKVYKDDPFEIRLRPGLALQQVTRKISYKGMTYKLGGSFIVRNPMNQGDQARLEADFTRSQRVLEFSYRRPWLLSLPVRTVFKAYNNMYQQPGSIGIEKNLYTVTQQGFLMGMNKQDDIYNAGLNLGFEWMETVVQDKSSESDLFARHIARAIDFEPRLLGHKIPYTVFEPTLVVNWVDDNAFPHKGIFTLLSLKGMIPMNRKYGDIYFVRLQAEQTVYVPLRSVVLALRGRVGHIFYQSFKSIMPTERFYLGGANSVRSYETDLCPPLGLYQPENGCAQYVPQGGKSMINLNIEARIPLYGRLGGVLFQDLGGLSRTNIAELRQEDLLAATGFGFRYHTPLGPLRFDFGIKWRAQVPHESRYAWFLTFGHAF